MHTASARLLALTLVIAVGLCAGCLFIPLGYPTWSRTPEVNLNAPQDEVLAVLVMKQHTYTNWTPLGLPVESCEIVKFVTFDPSRKLEAQNALTWDGALAGFVVCVPVLAVGRTTAEVRLYRPGYEAVTIPAWGSQTAIHWHPAESIAEQVQALDKVAIEKSQLTKAEQQLYTLFLSREYERLAAAAASLPDGGKLRQALLANSHGLLKKARNLQYEDKDDEEEKAVKQAEHQEVQK
jgi:hypothetical protein